MGTVVPLWLVSVDPGKRRSGVAVYRAGVLVFAADVLSHDADGGPAGMARAILDAVGRSGASATEATWVCEWPQDYEDFRVAHGDLAALRAVVLTLGFDADMGNAPFKRVRPRTWKGNVPKDVHHTRIRSVMSEGERTRVAGLGLDGMDAVGLGLWALGRVLRGGVARTKG